MMKFRSVLVPAVALCVMLPAVAAVAATEKTAPGLDNPYLPKIEKATTDLGDKLDKNALKHLYYVREGFGATRAVMLVRRDVDAAVKACGKANPDMKGDLDAEFSKWTSEVDPIVKQNETMINRAIAEQTYIKPKEINDYLKLIQQAGEYANKEIDKQIVTTPEACASLEKSMDKTRTAVSKLLSEMKLLVWPLSESESVTGRDVVGSKKTLSKNE
jgi:asparagine synthetase B (glutamine-hydrolysing)